MTGQDNASLDASYNSDMEITLAVLNAVHDNASLTQRSVARQLGMALGLVNAYLKRCVTKGYIKISQVPPRRYAYYLTPTGFAEKRRLTAEYLRQSFKFVQAARHDCGREFEACCRRGWSRVVFHGAGDFADIAFLCSREFDIDLVAVVDPEAGLETYHGVPVVSAPADIADPWDVVLVTDLVNAQGVFDRLRTQYPVERLLVPKLLGVSRSGLYEEMIP